MTKWIVGLLLLANLVLIGWMRWGSALTVEGGEAAQAALNADRIRLLDMQPASAAASAVPGVSLTLSPLPLPMSAPAPSAASAVPVASVASAVPVAPSTPAAASSVSAAASHVGAASHVQPVEVGCAEWGEFSGEDLANAQRVLVSLKLGDRLSLRSVERHHGYWVYLPPMKKHADVARKIAQLKERNVKDYFVVQEKGKWRNAISLGIFKTKEAAQKYLVSLREKDVRSAKVGERATTLKFTVFAMKGLDAATSEKLKSLQKGFPDSELKFSACGN